jgi:protein-L-isoaspartate(D-aspartate) O-methyltransferase
MTQELALQPSEKVLEIGTGCGYQAAILSELCRMVCTVEIIPELQERSQAKLKSLGYKGIRIQLSDGTTGWPEEAPFDGIIVTAAAPVMPENLIKQLRVGGRMVLPLVIDRWGRQFLHRVTRTEDSYDDVELYEVRFVPMVGEIEEGT